MYFLLSLKDFYRLCQCPHNVDAETEFAKGFVNGFLDSFRLATFLFFELDKEDELILSKEHSVGETYLGWSLALEVAKAILVGTVTSFIFNSAL